MYGPLLFSGTFNLPCFLLEQPARRGGSAKSEKIGDHNLTFIWNKDNDVIILVVSFQNRSSDIGFS